MKTCCLLLLIAVIFLLPPDLFGQKVRQEMTTVEDVYKAYPARIDALLQSLDLNRKGLEKVAAARAKGDAVSGCKALLQYYRQGQTTKYLRREQPATSQAKDAAADSIVQHIFTFYDVPDIVPTLPTGQLDWSHSGPDDDIEWAWGLNRHSHLRTLLGAYFTTGNSIYAKTIDSHIQDWVISSLPYPAVKSSTAMWRGLEVALRAKVWVQVFFALVNSDHLTPATKILMLSSLPDHTHYMENFHAKAGNWLTMEMSGLAMVATAWPEFKKSSEWVAYTKTNMLEGLKDQVYPDGVQKELTSHYHQVALYNFQHFLEICENANEPLPDGYRQELEKMENYLAYSLSPTGYGILNNDSDTRYNREVVSQSALKYAREDWMFIASSGKKGKRPAGPPSAVFPWAGQVIMRSGYDADAQWLFFDNGPWGTGHQHNDKLHISLTAYGRDLLVDGGRFAYRGEFAEKFRRYAVGSASHNVVLIDGKGQDAGPTVAEEPLSENECRITERFDYASGSFDRFRDLDGNAKHTRALFYVRGKFWVVVDQIDTDRPRKIETLWHWYPGSTVNIEEGGVLSTDHEKGNLKIIPVGFDTWKVDNVVGQEQPKPQGWYSERYNKAEPAIASIYSAEVENPTAFVWLLYPTERSGGKIIAEVLSRNEDFITVRVKDESLNEWDVKIPFSKSKEADYTFRSSKEKLIDPDNRRGGIETKSLNTLLSRLDLTKPGLEKVKAALNNPDLAASELLQYYRNRNFVKHPIERNTREKLVGKIADEKDIQIAEDAMSHIFTGQSAYPPYFCGDDINWGFRPVPDNEWVWQLNRMGFWDAMGKAYWHTGDEKYAREWCLQLLDWTQKNPRDAEHHYAWRSIEAGIRGYRWMGLFQRFLDSPSFSPDVLVAFLNSSYDHAAYLMTKYQKGSNWALMEAEGMAYIAFNFPEFKDAPAWQSEAISRLNHEIENQVYADGQQRELAMGYHTSSIGWFKRTLDLATLNGLRDAFPESYLRTIEKMCEVPFKLGYPNGTTPQFGDAWTGKPGQAWPMMKEWAELFDRDDFLFVATEGKQGRKPKETAFALSQSGLYSLRSGWDKNSICFVLKCGPDGGAHSQPDNGTFELYAGGRNLMPDAGSYIYSGDPEWRAWFRQTKVHQTLTLNDGNSKYKPKQLLWKPGRDLDILVVENAGYPDLTHRRAVFFVDKKYFVIVDEATGTGSGNVDLHFQLAPGEAVVDSAKYFLRSDFSEGWNVFVQSMEQRGLQLQEEEGWVSFVYTQKERRPAFRYRIRKAPENGVRFVTVVAPYEGSVPPSVTAELLGNPPTGSSRIELKVNLNGASRKISYQLPRK